MYNYSFITRISCIIKFKLKLIIPNTYTYRQYMVIKHIVICGGGPTGLLSYGALKYLAQQGFWTHDNVETIYGTSVGALIGAMLCLKHEWTTLDDYLIKRPWEKVIVESLEMLEKPGNMAKIRAKNPELNSKSDKEIRGMLQQQDQLIYSANFTFVISLLGLTMYSIFNSIFISLIYRKFLFRER